MKQTKGQAIIHTLAQAIAKGEFSKGDKLPSIRQLSQDFHCSKDTVQKALLELRYQNLIYAVPKSGYYVLEGQMQQESDKQMALSLEDYSKLAYQDFSTCLNETLIGRESYLFNANSQAKGLRELREALSKHLMDQAIYAKQDQLVVTSGTQQALYILSQMTFPNQRQTILIEQPTYHRFNQLISQQGLPFETITRGPQGFDFDRLEEIFARGDIKFFYTIPRLSNPLGLSYSKIDKERLLELAERYQVYIVEDDYMGDFSRPDDLPLHYYDTQDRVIYLKSFSTTVFQPLRLGLCLLPSHIMDDFLAYKALMDYDTSLIMQKALALYLENGMFDKNIAKLKHLFQHRMETAQQTLSSLPQDWKIIIGPKYVSIFLPTKLRPGIFKQAGLPFLPANSFYHPKKSPILYLRNDHQLPNQIKTIQSLIKKLEP